VTKAAWQLMAIPGVQKPHWEAWKLDRRAAASKKL
jgi:hypothetical protein